METATRNITVQVFPSKKQVACLETWLDLHRELYNAALQERRDAYKKQGLSIGYTHQQNELPGVKAERPELVPLGSHALQETVRRVDRAFQGFFRRVKAGLTPGFPRFKGKARFDSFKYPDPAGWKLLSHQGKRGRLQVTHLGALSFRGKPRVPFSSGELRTLEIRRSRGKWYATLAVRYPLDALTRPRPIGDRPVGLDAGCTSLLFTSEGQAIAHPKLLGKAKDQLRREQKNLSRKQRGSQSRVKARARVAKLHEVVAHRRRDFLHQLTLKLVSTYSFIAVEKLAIKNMTRSARGTHEKPGSNVRQKAGLNRSLLDGGLGMLFSMLESKAAEAGVELVKVNPRNTSQRCFRCGALVPKPLSQRWHRCPHCGFSADRDHNAALNILALGLSQAGREPPKELRDGVSLPVTFETPPMFHSSTG